MEATAAHRVSERMADRTCTRGWAWMTDKCKRRINRRGRIYNNRDLTKKGGRLGRRGRPRNGEAQRKEGGSCVTERGWRIPVLE